MWSAVLRFCAWLARQVWRFGVWAVNKIVAYAKKYWKKVGEWILGGVAYETIAYWIKRALGID